VIARGRSRPPERRVRLTLMARRSRMPKRLRDARKLRRQRRRLVRGLLAQARRGQKRGAQA